MTDKKTYIKTVTWSTDETVMVIDIVKSGNGYCTEWWISSNFGGNLQVVGYYSSPTYGYELPELERRIESLANHEVPLFSVRMFGGEGALSDTPNPSRKREIARLHILGHWSVLQEWSLMERTVEMYKLIEQFKVKDSAELIAELEDVKVRAVHERIQRARREGLLPRK
jgi:hypothetical protein